MARRLPARGRNGRFKKGGGGRRRSTARRKRSTRRNPTRRVGVSTTTKQNPRRRRRRTTTRRNPRVVNQLTEGVRNAAGVLVGKAAARTIPSIVGLPKQGMLGLGIQAAVAVVAGGAADRFLGREWGKMVLAGALTAPLETLVVAYNVPFLSAALSPVTASAEVGQYVGSYVTPRVLPAPSGMGSYVTPEDDGSWANVEDSGWMQ